MGGNDDSDEDRNAILRRRRKFIAVALAGMSTVGCDRCIPGPCLEAPPAIHQETPPQPCLTEAIEMHPIPPTMGPELPEAPEPTMAPDMDPQPEADMDPDPVAPMMGTPMMVRPGPCLRVRRPPPMACLNIALDRDDDL